MVTKRKIIARVNDEDLVKDLTIQRAILEFNRYQAANARSIETAKTYANSLHIFSLWLIDAFGEIDISISYLNNPEFIDRYIMWLRTVRNINETSVCFHKRHLRVFLYWLMDRDYIHHYTIIIKLPQEEVIETYTDDELKKLMRKPKTVDFVENRDWVIVNLMLSTGNRRATIVGYRIQDVDLEEHYLILNKTKNKRGQRLPIERKLEPILREYINTYRVGCTPDEPLFSTLFGDWLTPNSLTHSISTYNRVRGVYKTSMHLYRHTCAKIWIRNGGDSLRLQSMLGHSSLSMTEKYVRLFSDDLREPMDKFSPLNTLGVKTNVSINQRIAENKRGRKNNK